MAIFFITFVILLLVGVPISFSIGASAVLGCPHRYFCEDCVCHPNVPYREPCRRHAL